MKAFSKSSSIVLMALFILVAGYAVVKLQDLPKAILSALNITEIGAIHTAESIAYQHYVPLLFAFSIIMVLIFVISARNYRKAQEHVVYIERNHHSTSATEHAKDEAAEKALNEQLDRLKYNLSQYRDLPSQQQIEKAFSHICKELEIASGAFYQAFDSAEAGKYLEMVAGFAFHVPASQRLRFEFGEGLVGQAALSAQELVTTKIPDGYIRAISGLGQATPANLAIMPINSEEGVKGVVELASFHEFTEPDLDLLRHFCNLVNVAIFQETVSI